MDQKGLRNHFLGISLFVLAVFSFTVTYAFYKACGPYLSSPQIFCLSNFCSWVLILPFALKKGFKWLATEHFSLIILRSLVGIVAILSIILALKSISLSEDMLLNNTSPLFIPFIVLIWNKIKIPHSLWAGIIIGFIGIAIILRPGFGSFNIGHVFGLISGIATAFMLVIIRKIAHVPYMKILFYYFLCGWVLLSPFLWFHWTSPPPIVWIYLVSSSALLVLAQLAMTSTFRYISSHEAAPFLYTSVVFGGLIDWIIWKNTPDLLSLVGMTIVCIGGMVTLIRKKD